jgi:hypothetical protein
MNNPPNITWEQYKADPEAFKQSLLDNAAVKREVRPWDFLNPKTEYADEKLSKDRLSICYTCPQLIKTTKQCKKCGCFMHLKTKLAEATCPLGKW